MVNGMNILLLIIIFITVIVGYSFRFLTISGSIAAALVGILTVLGLDIKGLILLGTFFATSSLWSKYKRMNKQKAEERHAKGAQRDWQQVLANGGLAAVISLLYFLDRSPVWIFAFSILIASSNSDTWASEIGTLSKKRPISVRTLSPAVEGTSGAVSFLGTVASLGGSLLIAIFAFYLFNLEFYTAFLIFVFGFVGNLIDTLLGAFFQAVYKCKHCQLETEKVIHCGQKTELVRGTPFLNNDVVNFLSSFLAVLIGIVFF